jgi:hypothetical protein
MVDSTTSPGAAFFLQRLRTRGVPPRSRVEIPEKGYAVLLERARMHRSHLPPDSSLGSADLLPLASNGQRQALALDSLLARNAALRRAHKVVLNRQDYMEALDAHYDAILSELGSQVSASHYRLIGQLRKQPHAGGRASREAQLRVAQSRHLVEMAERVLVAAPALDTVSDDGDIGDPAAASLPADRTLEVDHPTDGVAWEGMNDLAAGTMEFSSNLLQSYARILPGDSDAGA